MRGLLRLRSGFARTRDDTPPKSCKALSETGAPGEARGWLFLGGALLADIGFVDLCEGHAGFSRVCESFFGVPRHGSVDKRITLRRQYGNEFGQALPGAGELPRQ